MIKEYFRGIWTDRYVLMSLVIRDLQMKYRRSKLGIAWSILTPLGLVLIVGSVYSILFGADPRVFIPQLYAGLNPWIFLSASLDGGTLSFLSAEGYIKQTTVSAQIFPLRVCLVNGINLLYSIVAFFAVYLFLQPNCFGLIMLATIFGLFIMMLFVAGMTTIVANIHLTVRDFQPLQSLMLQGFFYVTPIIYEPSMLAEKGFAWIYELNPFYYILEIVRRPMLGRELPTAKTYIVAILLAVSAFLMGIWIMMKEKKEIAFKL